jgi:hypothetical protein
VGAELHGHRSPDLVRATLGSYVGCRYCVNCQVKLNLVNEAKATTAPASTNLFTITNLDNEKSAKRSRARSPLALRFPGPPVKKSEQP